MASFSYSFRIGRSTTNTIIRETYEAISSSLKPIVLAKPDGNIWLDIAEAYHGQWQFPNCLGAIDGKQVLLQAPPKSGSCFHNYKGTISIILLACVDANYKFVLVDIDAEGHNSDAGVFINSVFGQSLEKGTLDLPCPVEIPGTTKMLPFLFIGDEAFPLKSNLMRPYPGVELLKDKAIFNYRLSRARRRGNFNQGRRSNSESTVTSDSVPQQFSTSNSNVSASEKKLCNLNNSYKSEFNSGFKNVIVDLNVLAGVFSEAVKCLQCGATGLCSGGALELDILCDFCSYSYKFCSSKQCKAEIGKPSN
ncbi:DDE Tnp4 domain-containing protein [Trichonephila clavata]|uniref:DDE Tnp4 domain-containing protein n=1 Tax=Trichonephila clavata TaxID=2740835 RepID=A0A8X6G0C9_TRICU|nr:DDE Tnp4 domain-containing protein [Trichonephila clavata]